MNKEDVVPVYCEILLTKRNEMESFVMMWIDPKSVLWSKVSQKEKNYHHILMHICGI